MSARLTPLACCCDAATRGRSLGGQMSLHGLGLFLVFGLVTVQGSGYSGFKKSPLQSG